MSTSESSLPVRLLQRIVDVQRDEVKAMLYSCLYFFFAMCSYFILRPIRDEMAVAAGVKDLPWLFAATLGAMLIANPLYAAVVSRFAVRRFVAITYGFFAANLLAFYVLWRLSVAQTAVGRTFFVWTSVFNLFVLSVFWGVMADTFHQTRAKRVFGFIAVGGTVGAVSGSAITSFFVQKLGVANLLLVSATLVLLPLVFLWRLPRLTSPTASDTPEEKQQERAIIGGRVWSGITHVLRSPYLGGIAVFLFLYTFGSTVLYFAQTDVIGHVYHDRALRTAVLARMELVVQSLAGIGQVLVTGRAIRSFGLPVTLAAVPLVSVLGFAALGSTGWGVMPLLGTFIVFNVARRSTEFMLTNPSRKVLFTVMTREDKYKATSFIETFVYRLGDQIASWGYAGLAALGLTLIGISWIAVPVSVAYLALGVWLGRRHRLLAARQPAQGPEQAAPQPVPAPPTTPPLSPTTGAVRR